MAAQKNAIKAMEAMMSKEQVRHARLASEKEIFNLRLAELRAQQGLKQSDLKAFTQTAVSRLERRRDMKLSTLIEYVQGVGMGLEIRVYRKGAGRSGKAQTLLKT
jgi:hypothetical protein